MSLAGAMSHKISLHSVMMTMKHIQVVTLEDCLRATTNTESFQA
jgi:hypothetical protein